MFKTKKILPAITLLAVCAASNSFAHDHKLGMAERIASSIDVSRLSERYVDLDKVKCQNCFVSIDAEKKFKAILGQKINEMNKNNNENIKKLLANEINATFSENELSELLTFTSSELGKKFLSTTVDINSKLNLPASKIVAKELTSATLAAFTEATEQKLTTPEVLTILEQLREVDDHPM